MQLQLDIGNTRLKWRLLNGATRIAGGFLARAAYHTEQEVLQELATVLSEDARAPDSVRVASVAAAPMASAIDSWCRQQWQVQPLFARVTGEAAGVRVGYDQPSQLGVDRWLAVLAASHRVTGSALVVDCGSAVTVDVLQDNQHGGGYIVPGLRLMHSALYRQTARVQVVQAWEEADPAPGRSTPAAVNHGIPLMVAALVREVFRRQGSSQSQPSQVLLTGGDARLLASLLGDLPVQLVEELVLDGLSLADCVPLAALEDGSSGCKS